MMGVGAVAAQGPAAAEPLSSAAGFGLGFAAGESLADVMAERFFGIPRDIARPQGVVGRITEPLQTGMTAAALNATMNKGIKVIGDKLSARSAKKAALKAANEIPEQDKLSAIVKQNFETLEDLASIDKTVNLPGTDSPVLAHQMLPDTKHAQSVAQSVKFRNDFEVLQQQAGKNISETVLDMVEASADLQPKGLKQVIKSGLARDRSGLNVKIGDLLESSAKEQGKIIQTFRDQASSAARKAPLPAPKTEQALLEVFDILGVRRRGDELIFPDNDTMAQILGTDSKAFIGGLKRDLENLSTKMARGGLTIDELIGQSSIIGKKNKSAGRIGGIYKLAIGKISSSLRSDSREAVPMILNDDNAKASYNAAMDKFRKFAQSRESLEKLFEEPMGSSTFAKALLTSGRKGLGTLRAAKEFLLSENPELWKEVSAQFFEELALKHRNVTSAGKSGIDYNTEGMRKELQKYGREFLDELLPTKEGITPGLVLRTLDLSSQLQKTMITGTDDELKKVGARTVGALSSFLSAKVNAVWAVMHLGGAQNRMLKLMSRDGIEGFLKDVPEKNKGKIRQTLTGLMNYAKQQGLLQEIGRGALVGQSAEVGSDVLTEAGQGAAVLQDIIRQQSGQR
jgi:hypothetical protein